MPPFILKVKGEGGSGPTPTVPKRGPIWIIDDNDLRQRVLLGRDLKSLCLVQPSDLLRSTVLLELCGEGLLRPAVTTFKEKEKMEREKFATLCFSA